MRTALLFALVALPVPAFAGGIAPIVTGGFHTEEVAYYSNQKDGGDGPRIPDSSNYERFSETQAIGNLGSGIELVVGDRDEKVQGIFRGYWMMDFPQVAPDQKGEVVDEDALIAAIRDKANHVGIGTVGIQWGVASVAQDKLKINVALNLGAAFATKDHGEFFLGQAGGNINYKITRTLEVFGDVAYGLRIRKTLSHGAYVTAGLRVMFD